MEIIIILLSASLVMTGAIIWVLVTKPNVPSLNDQINDQLEYIKKLEEEKRQTKSALKDLIFEKEHGVLTDTSLITHLKDLYYN